MHFDPIPDALYAKLRNITPSHDGTMSYYPCRVQLRRGHWLPHVYVVAAADFQRTWGIGIGRRYVAMSEVVDLEEDPDRLPPQYANALYKAGESGMGFSLFRVVFRNGHEAGYVTGNAVDFLPYPPGLGAADILAVHPHQGRSATAVQGLEYSWCLFRHVRPGT